MLALETATQQVEPESPHRQELAVAVLDLRKAFDTVPLAEVWRSMEELSFEQFEEKKKREHEERM